MCISKAPGICFIVPPDILTHVSRNATDPDTRDRALENLQMQSHIRGRRSAFSQFSFAGLGTGTMRRTIFDCHHLPVLPGKLARGEGQEPTNDTGVTEAYDASGMTYDFFLSVFKRNSIDDNGMRLNSSVHFARNFGNAFWDGQQMVYGDGDGTLFHPLTHCIDVIGHEMTHGMTQFTAGLDYRDQSGALNESMSDCFGIMLKQFVRKQSAAQSDWLIGEGVFVPAETGHRTALRSMKAPGTAYDDPVLGKDRQPAHMTNYVSTSRDNGGVHINSGIPNHAFYLAATKLGGNSWEVAGQVWYEVLTTRLRSNSQFADAAAATREVAQRYGKEAAEAINEAWREVGL